MDADARQRLREEVDAVTRLRFAVDDLAGRVERLERRVPSRRLSPQAELDELRVRLAALEALNGIPTGMPVGARLRQREAVRLRQEGYSLRRIAAALGCARGTVEGDLARAAIAAPADSETPAADGKMLGKRAANGSRARA